MCATLQAIAIEVESYLGEINVCYCVKKRCNCKRKRHWKGSSAYIPKNKPLRKGPWLVHSSKEQLIQTVRDLRKGTKQDSDLRKLTDFEVLIEWRNVKKRRSSVFKKIELESRVKRISVEISMTCSNSVYGYFIGTMKLPIVSLRTIQRICYALDFTIGELNSQSLTSMMQSHLQKIELSLDAKRRKTGKMFIFHRCRTHDSDLAYNDRSSEHVQKRQAMDKWLKTTKRPPPSTLVDRSQFPFECEEGKNLSPDKFKEYFLQWTAKMMEQYSIDEISLRQLCWIGSQFDEVYTKGSFVVGTRTDQVLGSVRLSKFGGANPYAQQRQESKVYEVFIMRPVFSQLTCVVAMVPKGHKESIGRRPSFLHNINKLLIRMFDANVHYASCFDGAKPNVTSMECVMGKRSCNGIGRKLRGDNIDKLTKELLAIQQRELQQQDVLESPCTLLGNVGDILNATQASEVVSNLSKSSKISKTANQRLDTLFNRSGGRIRQYLVRDSRLSDNFVYFICAAHSFKAFKNFLDKRRVVNYGGKRFIVEDLAKYCLKLKSKCIKSGWEDPAPNLCDTDWVNSNSYRKMDARRPYRAFSDNSVKWLKSCHHGKFGDRKLPSWEESTRPDGLLEAAELFQHLNNIYSKFLLSNGRVYGASDHRYLTAMSSYERLLKWYIQENPTLGTLEDVPSIPTVNGLVANMEGARRKFVELEVLESAVEGKFTFPLALKLQQLTTSSRAESFFSELRLRSGSRAMDSADCERAAIKSNANLVFHDHDKKFYAKRTDYEQFDQDDTDDETGVASEEPSTTQTDYISKRDLMQFARALTMKMNDQRIKALMQM